MTDSDKLNDRRKTLIEMVKDAECVKPGKCSKKAKCEKCAMEFIAEYEWLVEKRVLNIAFNIFTIGIVLTIIGVGALIGVSIIL